jgi:hypothetical protein
MKRSVAILGHTPMFVRWAIALPCPLRELDLRRLPETTFRQLRSVRELSLAEVEHRVHAGICWHPHARIVQPHEALGFPVDEVLEMMGGRCQVNENCGTCQANAGLAISDHYWAGCFGCLSTDLRCSADQILRGQRLSLALQSDGAAGAAGAAETNDLRLIVNRLARKESYDRVENPYRDRLSGTTASKENDTSSLWVRLWQHRIPNADQLALIQAALQRVLEFIDVSFKQSEASAANIHSREPFRRDLVQLIRAVQISRQHQLPLHLELVPAGFSDGQHWRLYAHCQICKEDWLDRRKLCRNCGADGRYQNEIKLKVLGLRPYLRLAEIIGRGEVERVLQERFLDS